MKKFLCFVLATVCALCVFCLVGCKQSPLEAAKANGDSYTIVCAYDEANHTLTAVQTVQLTNRCQNSFAEVKFHLYANAYSQEATGVVPEAYRLLAYPNGDSFGEISLDCVKVGATPVAFTVEGADADILSVPLEKEWFPDQKIDVELTYTVTLANMKHRLGWTDNAVNLGNFFPIVCHTHNDSFCTTPYYNIGDPFVSEVANFDVTLKIDEKYLVAATGNLVEAKAENGFVTYRYTADAVRDFAFVCSNKFNKISQTVGNTTINYFYFADEQSEASLATAVAAFEFFAQHIGDYPYKQLSVCETDFCYGGMEYPSLVMITSGSRSYQEAIAHEVAHQWFYAVVGNDQIEHAWMDEGLAEFLTYLYLDDAGATKLSQSVLAAVKTYTTYVDVLQNYYHNVNTTFRNLADYKNDNEYVVMTYVKGSLMFNSLYEMMGKAKFWRALEQYYNEAMFSIAPPSQMAEVFARVGGKELANVFENFATGKEIIGQFAK